MKKAFKGLFRSKKPKKEEPTPTTSSGATSQAHVEPTETTPAAPAPATTPWAHEPAKTELMPARTSSVAPQPAAVPAQDEPNTGEAPALNDVKKASQSRSIFHVPDPQQYRDANYWSGSKRSSQWIMTGVVSSEIAGQQSAVDALSKRLVFCSPSFVPGCYLFQHYDAIAPK